MQCLVLAAVMYAVCQVCDGQVTTVTPPTDCTTLGNGRFANTSDTVTGTLCTRSYYWCFLQADGTFLQWNYTCPGTTVFNPRVHLCVLAAACPTS